jgi:hypothetical protein
MVSRARFKMDGQEKDVELTGGELLTLSLHAVDYQTFVNILHRPNGFKPAGTPGESEHHSTAT